MQNLRVSISKTSKSLRSKQHRTVVKIFIYKIHSNVSVGCDVVWYYPDRRLCFFLCKRWSFLANEVKVISSHQYNSDAHARPWCKTDGWTLKQLGHVPRHLSIGIFEDIFHHHLDDPSRWVRNSFNVLIINSASALITKFQETRFALYQQIKPARWWPSWTSLKNF